MHVLPGWNCREKVEDFFAVLHEAHIVIPLIKTDYLFRNSIANFMTLDD